MRRSRLSLIFVILLAACSGGSSEAEPVTIHIPIPVEQFSPDADLMISVWKETQMALSDSTAGCSVSYDMASGKEEFSCPPGVTYQPPQPEVFTIPAPLADDSISVTAKSLKPGERFRVNIRGRSADECNSTAAQYEGKVRSRDITVNDLMWATTAMACLTPEPTP